MFNFGFSELLLLGIIALVFIGPKQLPQVAQTVGRLLNELKRATGDITGTFVDMRNEADASLRRAKDELMEETQSLMNLEGKDPEPEKTQVKADSDSSATTDSDSDSKTEA